MNELMSCEMTTLISDRSTIGIGDNATTFNNVKPLRRILDLTLQLHDMLVEIAATPLAKRDSLSLNCLHRSYPLLKVLHSIGSAIVCQYLLSHLVIKRFF